MAMGMVAVDKAQPGDDDSVVAWEVRVGHVSVGIPHCFPPRRPHLLPRALRVVHISGTGNAWQMTGTVGRSVGIPACQSPPARHRARRPNWRMQECG
jgi:hypothetical protein